MPKPSPREEQHLEPLSETTEESEESRESSEESSSEDKPLSDIPEQSLYPGRESSEEELLEYSEHNLEIKGFHFKSESSSEEEPKPSTA
jgi:hypothetical protein